MGNLNNRNKTQWNKEVERFQIELKESIFRLITAYQKNRPPFFLQDTPQKKQELLSALLEQVLMGSGSTFYKSQQTLIQSAILQEAKKWQGDSSWSMVYDIIDNYTAGMYMDDVNLSDYTYIAESQEQILSQDLQKFSLLFKDTKYQKYASSLFERMKKKQELFAPDSIEHHKYRETYTTIPSDEHVMFLNILSDERVVMW